MTTERERLLTDAATCTRRALHMIQLTRSFCDERQPLNAACRARIARAIDHLKDAVRSAEAIPMEDQ